MRTYRLVFAAFLSIVAAAALAATPVDQGQGSTRVIPWRVTTTTSSGGAGTGTGYIAAGAPAANVSVSTLSAAATGLTAGAVYRVACNVPVFYRTGTGTPTALTSDAPLYGPAIDYVGLVGTSTAIAFVTAAGTGSCVVSLITP
jgi:hypothetical protein